MSNESLAPTTESVVASTPVAPTTSGDTQGSTPAPVDTTVPSEAKPATAEQGPRRDRAFATMRRENRELQRTLGRLEERIEAMSRPSQQTEDGQPPRTETRAPQVDRGEVELNKSVLQRIEEAGEDADDVEDVIEKITSDDVPISRAMRDYLGEAEKPYALAKWLTENPSEARKISRLSESVAVRALERREAELAKPATRKTTTAPPPVPTVGGRSAATFDPNTASMDEYAPHWHERQAKKQR